MNLLSAIKELWSFKSLIRQLAVRDLKARYKVSVLGFFWSLLRPLLTIIVLAVIFSQLIGMQSTTYSTPYYIILLASYMPWFYFSTALLEGVHSLLANANLIQKVYCPRSVFPASVVLSNLVNFLFSMIVVIPVIYILSDAYPTGALLYLPLIIMIHTAFLFGLCLMTSVLNVLYRDTAQVMEFLVFVWFYLSPVLYDVSQVFDKIGTAERFLLYFLNPMAGILELYRYVILASHFNAVGYNPVDLHMQHIVVFSAGIPFAIVVSLLTLVVGFMIHKKLEIRAVDAL